jgi:hypothetical protein
MPTVHRYNVTRFRDTPDDLGIAGPSLQPIGFCYPHVLKSQDPSKNTVGPILPYAAGGDLAYEQNARALRIRTPDGAAILNAENGTHGWMRHPHEQHADAVSRSQRAAVQHHTRVMVDWINDTTDCTIIANYSAPYHLPQADPDEDVESWYGFGALPHIAVKTSGIGLEAIMQINHIAARYQAMAERVVHHEPPKLALVFDPFDRGNVENFGNWQNRLVAGKSNLDMLGDGNIAVLFANGGRSPGAPYSVCDEHVMEFGYVFGDKG